MSSGPRKFSIARRVGREIFFCKKSFEPDPPLVINNDRSLNMGKSKCFQILCPLVCYYTLGPRHCPIWATSGSDLEQFSPNMWTPPYNRLAETVVYTLRPQGPLRDSTVVGHISFYATMVLAKPLRGRSLIIIRRATDKIGVVES